MTKQSRMQWKIEYSAMSKIKYNPRGEIADRNATWRHSANLNLSNPREVAKKRSFLILRLHERAEIYEYYSSQFL